MSKVSKRKRLTISLETKYKVIQLIDSKIPYKIILQKFKSQLNDIYNISKIKKNRQTIISEYEMNLSRKSSNEDNDDNVMTRETNGKCDKCDKLRQKLTKMNFVLRRK